MKEVSLPVLLAVIVVAIGAAAFLILDFAPNTLHGSPSAFATASLPPQYLPPQYNAPAPELRPVATRSIPRPSALTGLSTYGISDTTISVACSSCAGCTTCASVDGNTCTLDTDILEAGTCINITAHNVVFDCNGFTIAADATGFGVQIRAVENTTVRNCRIIDWTVGIVSTDRANNTLIEDSNLTGNGEGILINNTANFNTIRRVNSSFSGDDGIQLDGVVNATIEDSIFAFSTSHGINLNNGINDTTIRNTNSSNNSGDGIITDFPTRPAANLTVLNSIFDGNNAGIFHRVGTNAIMRNNNITNNARWGIRNGDSSGGDRDNSTFINNTFQNNGLASYALSAYNGAWTDLPELHFPSAYMTKTVALPPGTTEIRLTQQGYDTAHIDFASLDGQVPDTVTDETFGITVNPAKLALPDYDVIDAHDRTIRIAWTSGGDTLAIRAVEADTAGEPHVWPARGYKTYTVGADTTFKHHWYPASTHPDGPVHDRFTTDGTNVLIFSDVTPDNTLDANGDWAEARFLVNGVLKTFRVSPTDSTWGNSAMQYTPNAVYEHKTYSFAIPLAELEAGAGDTLAFKMAYYGTAADPPNGALVLERSDNHVVHNNSFNGDRNAVIPVFTFNSLIENNTIANQLDNGIRFSGVGGTSENNRLINNTINTTTTGIFVDTALNTTFINNTAIGTTNGVRFTSTTDTFFNNTIIGADTAWIDTTSGGTTNTEFNDTTFATPVTGSIRIFGNATIPDSIDVLTTELFTATNQSFLNSTEHYYFNQSAQITLNGITFSNPNATVDFEDDGTFIACNPPQCVEVSFGGGSFVFNVSSFTSYASIETGANGTDTINITFDKLDSPDPVVRGSTLTYQIQINNTGNATAENVTVVEGYPAGISFVNATPAPTSGNNTFALGNLTGGGITTINITVTVGSNLANGTVLNNTINLSFQNSTGNTITANDSELTTVLGIASLSVTKTDSPDPVNNGSVLSYTITITNTGDEIAYNITAVDGYPVNVTFNGSSPAPSAGNDTFTVGNLTAGASTTINITVNVSANTTSGVLNNTVNVTFTNASGASATATAFQATTVTTPGAPPVPASGGGGGGTNFHRTANITREQPVQTVPVTWPTVAPTTAAPNVPIPPALVEQMEAQDAYIAEQTPEPSALSGQSTAIRTAAKEETPDAYFIIGGIILLLAALLALFLLRKPNHPKKTAPPSHSHPHLKEIASSVEDVKRLIHEFGKKIER